ncbi:MAG: hypothetical protein DRJ98_01290 [Thermoprotei archaeon]|nr:MAG: hypothetical protein DRJ98_01290 [Thermoprotei archaeon]
MNNVRFIKAALLCGIILPFFAFSSIALAIAASPWFNWGNNALSDLGVEGVSALIFNSGLIFSGLLGVVFSLGLLNLYRSAGLLRVGSVLLLLSSLLLSSIGLFPETAGRIHFYVSLGFFALTPISLIVIGIGLIWTKFPKTGLTILLLSLSSGIPWLFPWSGLAIPETLAATLIVAALFTLSSASLRLLRPPFRGNMFSRELH